MKLLSSLILLSISSAVFSASPDIAVSMVPRGKVIEHFGRDYIIKTPAGTKIGIEFTRDGKFEEARGHNLNKGDDLEPGDGLISLSSAAHRLSKLGLKPEGHWTLEEDRKHGWIYEFKDMIVNAKTGDVVKLSESSLLPGKFPLQQARLTSEE